MSRLPLVLLFTISCTQVFAQNTERVYRRGVQIGVGVYYEEVFPLLYFDYFQAMEGQDVSQFPLRLENVSLDGGQSATYYANQDYSYGERTDYTRQLQWQLGVHKKRLGGLEWGIGLALAFGDYHTEDERFAPSDRDDFYLASRVSYQRIGVVGNLGYGLFNNYRLQPYLGLQALTSFDRFHSSDFKLKHQRSDAAAPLPEMAPVTSTNRDVRIRLVAALRYPVAKRVMISAETKFFPDFTRVYAGVAGRYRLTDY